jgi:hypothetical protein
MPGMFSVLEARDGRVTVGPIRGIDRMQTSEAASAVAPPVGWFSRTYGDQLALVQAQQANVTPRFPLAAEVLLRMYNVAEGDHLDGAIAVDPVAFAKLLRATGPVSARQLGLDVTADNAERVLMHDAYTMIDDHRVQDAYLSRLTARLWDRLGSGDVEGATLALALAEAAGENHIQLYARDAEEQRMLARLGISGDFTKSGSAVQFVYNNNYGMNKVDYYLRRHIDTRVQLRPDGSANVTTRVTVKNLAPRRGDSVLFDSPGKGALPGENRMILNVILPDGAQPYLSRSSESGTGRPSTFRESGRAVAWETFEVGPHDLETFTVAYRWPEAVRDGLFDLVLYPHTRSTPDTYSLTVEAPADSELEQSDGTSTTDLRTDGTLSREVPVEMRVVPL